jgi:hypothetical protein
MEGKRQGKKLLLDYDHKERLTSTSKRAEAFKGQALQQIMVAINAIEKKLGMKITDFSEFLGREQDEPAQGSVEQDTRGNKL